LLFCILALLQAVDWGKAPSAFELARANAKSANGGGLGDNGGSGKGDRRGNSGTGPADGTRSGGNGSGASGPVGTAGDNVSGNAATQSVPIAAPRRRGTKMAAKAAIREALVVLKRRTASVRKPGKVTKSRAAAAQRHKVLDRQRQSDSTLVATGIGREELRRLRTKGFREVSDGGQTSRVIRLSVPTGLSTAQARRLVQTLASEAIVDLNHLYYADGDTALAACTGECETASLVGFSKVVRGQCGELPTIGMIDTGVDLDHEMLREANVEVLTPFQSLARSPSGTSHGTAIAALLVGRTRDEVLGLLPDAHIVAVDAFFRDGGKEDKTDAASLVHAIEVLVARGVKVINLSLSGPANEILKATINGARNQGVVFIAAAGNNGPGASPSYPAAYPGVIAVTAVDHELGVYRHASRGRYINLAAPGVHIRAAGNSDVSGTSYAVPFVTAAAALLRGRNDSLSEDGIAMRLAASAWDLGDPGYDTTFGWGLLQVQDLCSPLTPLDVKAQGTSTVGVTSPAEVKRF